METKPTLTAAQALMQLRQTWSTKIKKGNGPNSFDMRLADTEEEMKLNHYHAEILRTAKVLKQLERADGKPTNFFYGSLAAFPKKGSCWVLTWENLLRGGFVAYLDAVTGEVYAIQVLQEG